MCRQIIPFETLLTHLPSPNNQEYEGLVTASHGEGSKINDRWGILGDGEDEDESDKMKFGLGMWVSNEFN